MAANNRGKMSDEKKTATSKKPVTESKAVEAKPEAAKTETAKTETAKTETKPDAPSKKQGMGEGQKRVSQAYKDNWNDIFGKKKKKR
jgi:hypothetical protein